MKTTISRLYDDHAAALKAVQDVRAAGIPHTDVSIVASNADNWYDGDGKGFATSNTVDRDRDGADDRAEGAATGASVGAGIGGAAGLLAGLGLMAIPGLGPVVAAGWLVSTAVGAVAGGATGGAIGALSQAGLSEEDAPIYAEGIRRGGSMVTARVEEKDRMRVEQILDQSSVNVRDRADAYRKSGWSGFDPDATPYTSDEARRERDLYRNL